MGVLVGVAVSISLIVGVGIGAFSGGNSPFGGVVSEIDFFRAGFKAGTGNQLVVDKNGNLTESATSIFSGNFIASSDVRLKVPVQTGTVTTIASSSVDTLTAAQVCDSSVIAKNSWNGIASSTAITNLPSAANIYSDCLTTDGDTLQIVFRNLHTTAGSSTAITAGASTTLVGVDANSDIINGTNEALLEFVRYSATEMIVIIREFTASD